MSRIAIIGTGNVGGALARSLRGVVADDALVLCDSADEKLARFDARHLTRDLNEAARLADTLIIAVKPQSFPALARAVTVPLRDKLVISVMAGIRMQGVADALRSAFVVRAMPNLGAQVGLGATAWIAAPACAAEHLERVRLVFRAAGVEFEVGDESLLDAFTALGGSGPAYFFHLAELLAESAAAMGFEPEQGRVLARQVLMASGRLLESGERDAGDWRRAVTTPGGTTEAAMGAFRERGLADAFRAGLEAARKRSEDLSGA